MDKVLSPKAFGSDESLLQLVLVGTHYEMQTSDQPELPRNLCQQIKASMQNLDDSPQP